MTKFELTSESKIVFGRTFYRIKALISFGNVEKDELGGWVEAEKNIDQSGNAWVSGDALVYGNARVSGDALVYGNARVYGNAWVSGDALVSGDAQCEKTPITITGLKYLIVIDDKMVRAGCKQYTAKQWREFTPNQVDAMDSAATEFYPVLIGLLDTFGLGL